MLNKTVIKNDTDKNVMYSRIVKSHPVPKSGDAFTLWHTDNKSYPFSKYPDYASGYFYLYKNSITKLLLRRILIQSTPIIKVEDVFLTGIVREAENISLVNLPGVFAYCTTVMLKKDSYRNETVIAVHHHDALLNACRPARIHLSMPQRTSKINAIGICKEVYDGRQRNATVHWRVKNVTSVLWKKCERFKTNQKDN